MGRVAGEAKRRPRARSLATSLSYFGRRKTSPIRPARRAARCFAMLGAPVRAAPAAPDAFTPASCSISSIRIVTKRWPTRCSTTSPPAARGRRSRSSCRAPRCAAVSNSTSPSVTACARTSGSPISRNGCGRRSAVCWTSRPARRSRRTGSCGAATGCWPRRSSTHRGARRRGSPRICRRPTTRCATSSRTVSRSSSITTSRIVPNGSAPGRPASRS